jgi:hypothetical protein
MFPCPERPPNGQGNKVGPMDLKIYVMMLLIAFLSALYHAGAPKALENNETA